MFKLKTIIGGVDVELSLDEARALRDSLNAWLQSDTKEVKLKHNPLDNPYIPPRPTYNHQPLVPPTYTSPASPPPNKIW